MNIAVCDDEITYRQSMCRHIRSWCEYHGHSNAVSVSSFSSSEDMLEAWEHGLQIDAAFLDIEIPKETNGMKVAQKLHSFNENITIAFVTGHGEYAEAGYHVNAVRFIHKPIDPIAIAECMDIMWRQWSFTSQRSLMLDLPNQIIRLPLSTIISVEAHGHQCCISTTDSNRTYIVPQTLSAIQSKLPSEMFVQCHRSYIVNLMFIRQIAAGQVTLLDDTKLPVSRSLQTNVRSRYLHFFTEGGADA